MSDTQHTPGEWRVDPRDGETIVDENGVIIASTQYNPANDPRFNVPGSNRGPGRPRTERLANAALIAAAPETAAERDRLREQNAALLAALEGLLGWADPWAVPGDQDAHEANVTAARAAIAAARG